MAQLIDQYQAALMLGISPELLEYFSTRTVKKGDPRKLKVHSRQGLIAWFEEAELKSYDAWLRGPWPAAPKKRPHLPDAIKNEIRSEAAGECALCLKNGNSCEAAHIEPVAQSRCNHPHNLLWLCANHHTKFDNGSIGPKGETNEVIRAAKLLLQTARKHVWQRTVDVSSTVAALLKLAKDVHGQLEAKSASAATAEGIGKKVLELLPQLASKNQDKDLEPVLEKIAAIASPPVGTSSFTTTESLAAVASLEDEFLNDAGLKTCPLCEGSRWHNDQECPVCQGDGAISKDKDPDLSAFDLVGCRLCEGQGSLDGELCPACSGEGRIEAGIEAQIDWDGFAKVECQLCGASGRHGSAGNECPVCAGERLVLRRDMERVDLREYQEVDCPLCEGSGSFDGDTCPECHGDRQMERRFADQVDVSAHEHEDCKACKGAGEFFDVTCPFCGGDRQLTRKQNDSIDPWELKLVTCPRCKGNGCEVCRDGELPRYFADRME
jgi:hypothetical protein